LQVARSAEFPVNFWDGGFWACGAHIYREEGVMGFWKGFTPCAIRAVVANSVLFCGYEFA